MRSATDDQPADRTMDFSKQLIRPEDFWPVDPVYEESYRTAVAIGRGAAKELDAAIVMIARNARPALANTLLLVEEMRKGFNDSSVYVFENDSTDGTDGLLDDYARATFGVTVDHETLGGEDIRGFGSDRTNRLAYCRNECLRYVRDEAPKTAWTIVLDCDPAAGFSVDGVFNSIGWLGRLSTRQDPLKAGGMASYSVMRHQHGRGVAKVLGYDAWAARLNDWRDRREEVGMEWFHWLLPPVGSHPIPMYSAFGGLAVYWTEAFLRGGYAGGDCEHVAHHRAMREAGYQMYLNPGCRYVAL